MKSCSHRHAQIVLYSHSGKSQQCDGCCSKSALVTLTVTTNHSSAMGVAACLVRISTIENTREARGSSKLVSNTAARVPGNQLDFDV